MKLYKYKFSDLYEMSSGISSSKDQAGHGSPFLSFSTVFNNFFLPDELPDLMDTTEDEQRTFSVKTGDVFITRTSETVDELAMSCVSLADYPNATFSGFLKRLRPIKKGIVYDKYIAFYLRSRFFRKVIENNTIMTLRASFNEDMFSFLELFLPDYETQVKTGEFLYDLEKKVQTSKKINDNLTALLDSLYMFWFVQNENTDWRHEKLGNLTHMYQPHTISGNELVENGEYSVYGANGVIGKYDKYNHEEHQIAVACRGASCGAVTMTMPFSWITGNAMVVSPLSDFMYKEYIYYSLRLKSISYLSSGSAQPQLTRENMSLYDVVIPDEESLKAFECLASKIRELLIYNEKQILELKKVMDWTIPMLMNGQLTISD